jgi:anti-anti-sigma factor
MPASSTGSEGSNGAIRVEAVSDGITTISLHGEFDLTNHHHVDEHIHQALASGDHLILDMTQTTFIDSWVINVLFQTAKAARGRDRTVVLQLATAPLVERVLEFVKIEDVLPRTRTRPEAIELIEHQTSLRKHG